MNHNFSQFGKNNIFQSQTIEWTQLQSNFRGGQLFSTPTRQINKRFDKMFQICSNDINSFSLIISMTTQPNVESKVIEQRQIYRGKWLGMKYVDFSIGKDTIKEYEKVFRTTSKPGQADGVDIIPIIKYNQKKSQLLMISEFRPPVNGFTLEFPTGMAENQNYEQNARRQLLEETGCVASSFEKIPYPTTYYDPWKSDETSKVLIANIDGDSRESFQQQKLEASQHIKTLRFDIDQNLLQNVTNYAKENNLHLQASVYAICLGLWFRINLKDI